MCLICLAMRIPPTLEDMGGVGGQEMGQVYKGAALPPPSLHLACISDPERNKEVCMEARIFLGLAIGLLAVSSVVGFRDNGVQHKWSPYKPRLEYAE